MISTFNSYFQIGENFGSNSQNHFPNRHLKRYNGRTQVELLQLANCYSLINKRCCRRIVMIIIFMRMFHKYRTNENFM